MKLQFSLFYVVCVAVGVASQDVAVENVSAILPTTKAPKSKGKKQPKKGNASHSKAGKKKKKSSSPLSSPPIESSFTEIPTSFPTKFPSSSPSNECFDDAGIVDAVAEYFDDRKDAEEQYGAIGSWSTCSITDLAGFNLGEQLFFRKEDFNEDLNGWNLSSVTSLYYTFVDAEKFNGRISDWDVSSTTSFEGCFRGTYSFNQDISGWDVASSENFGGMFHLAESFNQEISGWDVTSGEIFLYMFYLASSFNQCLDWSIDDTASTDLMFCGSQGSLGKPGAPCA